MSEQKNITYKSNPLSHEEADTLLKKVEQEIAEKTFDTTDNITIQKMVEGLGDTRGVVRLGFAEALGRIGKPAVSYIVEALQDHPNVVVQRAAGKTLTLIGDTSTIPVLINSFLHDPDQVVRNSCIGALANMGELSVSPLLDILASPENDETIKGHAAWGLAFIGTPGKEKLYQAIDSESEEVRSAVVAAIAKVMADKPEEKGLQIIVNSLQDNSQNVRSEAAAVLGNLSYKPAIPNLIQLLKDPETENRKAAALALMKIGDDRAIEPLQTALEKETRSQIKPVIKLAISQLERESESDDWD